MIHSPSTLFNKHMIFCVNIIIVYITQYWNVFIKKNRAAGIISETPDQLLESDETVLFSGDKHDEHIKRSELSAGLKSELAKPTNHSTQLSRDRDAQPASEWQKHNIHSHLNRLCHWKRV